ncbi:bacteriocin [Helicobacter ganmani]|uniref:bacteriocin n=1 Tax=Helicobacter ganmani TaxID=60246 RepID=UPI003A841928
MLKKILSIAVMSGLFSSGALAEDLLAKITNGALSDTSKGVRLLSAEEEKQVVGGYVVADFGSGNEWYGIALYTANELQKGGLCGLGIENCAAPSAGRLQDYAEIVNNTIGFFPVYIVRRSIKVSDLGRPYVLFNYQVGMLDTNMQLYKFGSTTSSIYLKNNLVIKELQNHFKTRFESNLGGWYAR